MSLCKWGSHSPLLLSWGLPQGPECHRTLKVMSRQLSSLWRVKEKTSATRTLSWQQRALPRVWGCVPPQGSTGWHWPSWVHSSLTSTQISCLARIPELMGQGRLSPLLLCSWSVDALVSLQLLTKQAPSGLRLFHLLPGFFPSSPPFLAFISAFLDGAQKHHPQGLPFPFACFTLFITRITVWNHIVSQSVYLFIFCPGIRISALWYKTTCLLPSIMSALSTVPGRV